MRDIADWQRRYYARPKVYALVDADGFTDEIYETEEAAKLAVDWHAEKLRYRMRIVPMNVCSLELSRERWAEEP
jgi:hypothetical protein